jgi:NAD(P)-dependent dehydrogenase (short-subunit alcohol dehydrogenase family)
MMEANFHFVRRSVLSLIEDNKVENPASFVFIGSVWSIFSKIDKSAYIVSKSALEGLARSLSVELAPANIRVNCVLPGVIDNSMTRSNLTELQLKRIQHETPGQKLITAVQVANIVKFLCSENSQGINGQSIIVDSGWSIARYI